MLGARSIPAPKGRLGTRSLGALLSSARARRATVVLSLSDGARAGEITFVQGRVLRATTSERIALLGALLFERGLVDDRRLAEALEEGARSGRLLGQILLERRALTPAQLAESLAEQTRRRVLHLFSSSPETSYEVKELKTPSSSSRDHGRPAVDPWPLVHRGLCLHPRPEVTLAAAQRLEGLIRLRDLRVIDELSLDPPERAFCEDLAVRPVSVNELLADTRIAREKAAHLVYVLALGRHLERTAGDVVGPVQLGAEGVRSRAHAAASDEPHALLGLAPEAPAEEVRAAYFRLARLWHPDRLPATLAAVRPDCEQVFARMTDAFRTLMEGPGSAVEAPPDSAPASRGRPALVSLPPPTVTMTDVDRALSRADFAKASRLASALVRTGSHGPAARAVIAMCDAAGAHATFLEVDGAIAELDRILGGDPDCVRALFYRGVLAKRVGRVEVAVRDFRRIVRLDPTHLDAQRELKLADGAPRAPAPSLRPSLPPAPSVPPRGSSVPARRQSDREGGLEPLSVGPTPQLSSGLRALLARVAGRS